MLSGTGMLVALRLPGPLRRRWPPSYDCPCSWTSGWRTRPRLRRHPFRLPPPAMLGDAELAGIELPTLVLLGAKSPSTG